MERQQFKETVILVDADYLDGLASDLRSNFTKVLGRDVPVADLAEWLVCAALDGGAPEDEKGESQGEVQVVFIRSLSKTRLDHFEPGNMLSGLDGQAFRDPYLGEFLLSVVPEEKPAGQTEPLFAESTRYLLTCKEIKRLVLVPDMQKYGDYLREDIGKAEGEDVPRVVILAMQPEEGGGYQTEILGYSLLHALGIAPEELQ